MQPIRRYIQYFLLITVTIILTSCSGACATDNNSDTNPPIIKVLPNSGNATLTIPISNISLPTGNLNTSTSISLADGTPGLVIGLSSTVSATQNTVVANSHLPQNNSISVNFKPESLVAESIVSSSIQINVNPNTPAGTYKIGIYADYLVNNLPANVLIGTLNLSYGGATPTPSPVAGTLSITPENLSVNINGQSTLTVSLDNSAMVSNLVVYLSTESPNVATVIPSSCTLSTVSNICTVSVNGINYGTSNITASASNYVSVSSNVTTINPWSQLGGNVTSAGYFSSITQDKSGNIYAGGYSSSTPNQGGVWRYDGTNWSQLGSNVSSAVAFASILSDKSGNIYAGGKSTNNYGGLWFYNGSSWSQLGGEVESAYSFACIIQDESDNIYAAGQAVGLTNAGVWMWNGATWSQLGGDYIPSAIAVNSMVRDGSGNIYAAGSAQGSVGAVWKWDGISWSQLGGNITGVNTFRSIIRDRLGNLYAAGTAPGGFLSGGGGGTVWMWDGTVWSQVGGSNVTNTGSFGSIMQDSQGNLYVGGQTKLGVMVANAWMWNGQTWRQLGTNINSSTGFISMFRDASGNIYAGGATPNPAAGGLWLYQP